MEIDDKLKNRLAGSVVVTALAIIFLPMLFDEPAEKKGQLVSEVEIPHKADAEVSPLLNTSIVPDKNSDVTNTATELDTNKASTSESSDALAATKTAESVPAVKDNSEAIKKVPVSSQEPDEPEDAQDGEEKAAPTLATSHDKVIEKKSEAAPKTEKEVKTAALPSLEGEKESPSIPQLDTESKSSLENHRWFIQVVSLTDQSKANAFRDKLRQQGFPATVDSAWIKGKGRVYRLKVGPELDAQQAESMKNKINQLNNVQSIAIPE